MEKVNFKKILFIIAAGNSTRMNKLPKAISIINSRPNLINTIELANPYFDDIVVVSNKTNQLLYEVVVKSTKAIIIPIESGHGCGHAIFQIFDIYSSRLEDYGKNVVVCWGDTYFPNNEMFKEILSRTQYGTLTIPVRWEKDPYVHFSHYKYKDNRGEHIFAKAALFKKRGQSIAEGYHDQSIFRMDGYYMYGHLINIHNYLFVDQEDVKYLHEMIFLDMVAYMYNVDCTVSLYETKYETLSYNTIEEIEIINNKFKR